MYKNINLEKGLYSISGKSFTEALSELDSDTNYDSTVLKGLDAFERQLKRFDIKVKGANSDRVEKFFQTTQSAVLFPEFVRRSIKAGMDEASVLGELSAAITKIEAVDYRGLNVIKTGANSPILEGGELPVTKVVLSQAVTPLVKLGRKISTSYEALRTQRLDVFAVVLKNIGAEISKAMNVSAVSALTNGVVPTNTGSDNLTYDDLVSFWANFGGYNLTTFVVSPATMAKIMALSEMKNGINEFISNGTIISPFGVRIIKCDGVEDDNIIGIDKSCALETVFGSDIVVDCDKLIGTQMDNATFSITAGFVKIANDATKAITIAR